MISDSKNKDNPKSVMIQILMDYDETAVAQIFKTYNQGREDLERELEHSLEALYLKMLKDKAHDNQQG